MNLPDKLKEKGQLHSNLDTFVNIDAHKKIDGSGGPRPSGPAEPVEGKKSPVSDPGKPKDGNCLLYTSKTSFFVFPLQIDISADCRACAIP